MRRFTFLLAIGLATLGVFVTSAHAQECDIAATIAQTASDSRLSSLKLSNDGTLHPYTEIRLDALKTFKDYKKDIALRVLDTATCATSIVKITKSYSTARMYVPVVTRGNIVWMLKQEPVAVLKAPSGWDIAVVRRANGIAWNNWNTQFQINAPTNRVVVGIKYPIVNDPPIKGQPRVTEFIDVPYSEPIATAQVIAAGKQYVTDTMTGAVGDLRKLGVISRALPDMLVADVITKYPKAFPIDKIMPVEHMDLTEFVLDPRWTTDRVYATIGANGDNFASFTCSPAGACGPQQFIESSYTMVRNAYPDARLLKDTNLGRREARNSMKAAILLLDLQLADYVKAFGSNIVNAQHIDELQFAGYNTGTKRVAQVYRVALATNASDWAEARGADCKKPAYHQCLVSETKGYVQGKFRYLRDEYALLSAVAVTQNKHP